MHDLIIQGIPDFRQNGRFPLPAAFAWTRQFICPLLCASRLKPPSSRISGGVTSLENSGLGHPWFSDSEQISSVNFVLKSIFKLTHAGAGMAEGRIACRGPVDNQTAIRSTQEPTYPRDLLRIAASCCLSRMTSSRTSNLAWPQQRIAWAFVSSRPEMLEFSHAVRLQILTQLMTISCSVKHVSSSQ